MRHRDDLVLGQIARLRDARILLEVTRCGHHHPAHFADPARHHGGVGEIADAQRGVKTLIDQVHRPVEQQEPRRHGRVSVQEGVEDRPQHDLAR